MVVQATRMAAQKVGKALVPGGLEFSIHSSLLLMSSLVQTIASVGGIWVVASGGFDWSKAREGFAAFCYLAAFLAAIAAGSLGVEVSGKHIFGNKEELVCSIHVWIVVVANTRKMGTGPCL